MYLVIDVHNDYDDNGNDDDDDDGDDGDNDDDDNDDEGEDDEEVSLHRVAVREAAGLCVICTECSTHLLLEPDHD